MPDLPLPPLQPEEWLTQRLANTARSDPRFEASWYGLYAALLSHYFPYQQRFLVKPQPKVRETFPEDETPIQAESSGVIDEPDALADVSMTSMGGLVACGGSTVIPDFIVTKATESASGDKALLIVEVKVGEPERSSELKKHKYQLSEYMYRIAEQTPRDTKLVGLLICGMVVTIHRLDHAGCEVDMDRRKRDINSRTIRRLLLDIASNNWAK